ncbi:MAG: N-acetylmuramoyl-L-alanine amidase [Chloroflexaceae bacterium]|nr:N-acetylmuramoyl-L-alanine amidase [Chloroflexaceae bacterium]
MVTTSAPSPPTRVVLHHTYIPNEKQWVGLRSMQGMQRYYASLGWSAAPHIYVGPDGIWLFTPMSRVGIHAGAGNSGSTNGKWWYSVGVEMVGYFDYVRPAGAVWEQTRLVLATLSQRLGIAPRQLISFHRDYTNLKSCPGWAVTHEWVYQEVEAYLSSGPPSNMPVGTLGRPTPPDELVLERLLHESYARRASGYNPGWAFHQFAVDNGLGMPMANSKRLTVDGVEYSYQPFARDTLYSQVPNWGIVQRMSQLLGGSIPPAGLGRALLEATYRDNSATFRPEWAFHQYAMRADMGPPIGESRTLVVNGLSYAYQVFARDTLYNLVPNWADVRQLSRLASTTDPASVALRDALLRATYAATGARYEPGWSFHQLARQWNIGAPLADPFVLDIEGVPYNIQVYALETVYNIVPYWSDVKRLSTLAAAQNMNIAGGTNFRSLVLGHSPLETAVLPVTDEPVPEVGGEWTPPASLISRVLHYTPVVPNYADREGARVLWLVLHGDTGPAQATLDWMATPGSLTSTHYYITSTGVIYGLAGERFMTFHAGDVMLRGGHVITMNRYSIGVVLERPDITNAPQMEALRWLVRDISSRHPRIKLLRWPSFKPAGLPPRAVGG